MRLPRGAARQEGDRGQPGEEGGGASRVAHSPGVMGVSPSLLHYLAGSGRHPESSARPCPHCRHPQGAVSAEGRGDVVTARARPPVDKGGVKVSHAGVIPKVEAGTTGHVAEGGGARSPPPECPIRVFLVTYLGAGLAQTTPGHSSGHASAFPQNPRAQGPGLASPHGQDL